MAIQQHLYRVTKRAIDALPPWLIRARPYGVLSVELTNHTAPAVQIDDKEGEWLLSWIDSDAQLQSIESISEATTRQSWNGTSQRVAVAWRKESDSVVEQPIGVAWIATETFDEHQLGISMALAPGQAWLHSAVVLPEWRKIGVYRTLLEFVIKSLRQEGVEQLLMGVSVGNVASLRSHQAVGAASIGKIVAVRFFGVTACVVRGAVSTSSGSPFGMGRRLSLSVDQGIG